MFKKGLVTLVCLTVLSAVWAMATTQYSISTKINSLGTKLNTATGKYEPIVGGSVKTRLDGTTDAIVSLTNGTKYTTVTTDKLVDVDVAADAGFKIASVTKTTDGTTTTLVTAAQNLKTYTVDDVAASATTQFIVVTFTADTTADVVSKTWQLQVTNNNAGGSIAVTRAGVTTNLTAAVKPLIKNYIDTTPVTVTATAGDGYFIDYVVVNGVKDNADRATFTATVNGANRLNTFNVGYKKTSIPVITNATPAVDNGIAPVNPVVDPYGNVRLIITPTGKQNVVTDVTTTAGVLALTNRYGEPVTLPFTGPVKATITGIKAVASVTVTATYGFDATQNAAYVNCTQTCHVDPNLAPAVATTLAAADSAWKTSKHSTTTTDCVGCHQTMPGPALSTVEQKAALCDKCHTTARAAEFATSPHWLSETGRESDADFIAAGHGSVASCAAKCHFVQGPQAGCAVCHSGKLQAGGTMLTGGDADHDPQIANATNTCYACHTGTKHGWSVRAFERGIHFTSAKADQYYQFKTVKCLNCHDSHSTEATFGTATTGCQTCHHAGADYSIYAADLTLKTPHGGGAYQAQAGDTPETYAKTQFVTQGAICSDCHGHDTTVNKGYAESGHGKVSDYSMNAFNHYDWSKRTNDGTRSNSNCDRCHTSGGFVKFTNQDVEMATRLTPVTNQPQGVLVCVTCHKYLEGENKEDMNLSLRTDAIPTGNVTALKDGYTALFTVGAVTKEVAFPGMKNSSICIPCHSGRTTDDVFVAVIDAAADPTIVSTSYYQHAANMGQTFIGEGAYDFTGLRVPAANSHMNVKNGINDNQGPCVGCHYAKAGATHSLEVVNFEVCASCHRAGFGAADLDKAEEEYNAGLKVLDALIREKFNPLRVDTTKTLETERVGVKFGLFGKPEGTTTGDAATAKNAYGAWYNWQLLSVWDKAAFAHNPAYAKQILFDTIDYLDGNGAALNNSAEATIEASNAVTAAEKEAALGYRAPACGTCHATTVASVQGGKHAYETSTHSGTCGRCHTTEGYVNFLATNADPSAVSATQFNGISNVSCAACHDTHGSVRTVDWNPTVADNTEVASAQYELCTSCHNLTNTAGAVVGTSMQQHGKDWYRNIASTHYDNPATQVIEGYAVRFNKESACSDCHGHEFYTNTGKALETPDGIDAAKGEQTIHTEWASSAHAGKLLAVKFENFTTNNPVPRTRTTTNMASVMAVGVTGATGPAWEHYDWDGLASRQSCQKCHTATGAATYLDAVKAFNDGTTATLVYNAANNDFSHLKAGAASRQEVLACWGCHTNAGTGATRNPGVMPADYKFEGGTANGTFPDVASSNLCLACHAGRTGGMNVKARTDLVAGTAVDFTNSHYLAAGGTLFKSVGFEYTAADRSYANSSSFAHDKLGTAAKAGTGTSGPCVACHLGNKANGGVKRFNHEFKLAGFEGGTCGTGAVAGACHATMTRTELDEEKEAFETALDALNALLADKGFAWSPISPYFAKADWTKNGAVDGKQTLGAAFNLNYLLHEPGAYAHNRYYAKRLIIDSLDFVYNNALEPLTSYTSGTRTYWTGSDAADAIQAMVGKTYTDHNNTVQTFTQAQADAAILYLDGDSAVAGIQRR